MISKPWVGVKDGVKNIGGWMESGAAVAVVVMVSVAVAATVAVGLGGSGVGVAVEYGGRGTNNCCPDEISADASRQLAN